MFHENFYAELIFIIQTNNEEGSGVKSTVDPMAGKMSLRQKAKKTKLK